MRLKKNGALAVADLVCALVRQHTGQLQQFGQLPEDACYEFDVAADEEYPKSPATIQKTVGRKVTTLAHGPFKAREVVRNRSTARRSEELADLVPAGCKYGYDLVAQIGIESFLHGRQVAELQREFAAGSPSIHIPTSSLNELRRRFLFNLGTVHRLAAPRLMEHLRSQDRITWLIDGTVEPGTPVFFGIYEAHLGVLLKARKMATENRVAIAPALRDAAEEFGMPDKILHDLSSTMSAACEEALSSVPHAVCHFHFARDVGEDLYRMPQVALTRRLRELKLQVCLREQRKTTTEWLRRNAQHSEGARLLDSLLRGHRPEHVPGQELWREVLLAFHFWMLDCAADGDRQGFPFDPHVLYLHRRFVQGHAAIECLLSRPAVSACAPRPLLNLRDQLSRYVRDPKIISTASHYETVASVFSRLREALDLSTADTNPMRAAYQLESGEDRQVEASLAALRTELQERSRTENEAEQEACKIVLTHLDKYWSRLVPDSSDSHRTTNALEGLWGTVKRACRHTQGGRKLTRTFEALPAELMLIANLQNPHYVEIVLGSLDQLARKFAETSSAAVSYPEWRQANRSLNLGRLPRRTLRRENLIEDLITVYDTHCQAVPGEAA